jgi:ABC-type antimicrobial peptide transport system, ATPase component
LPPTSGTILIDKTDLSTLSRSEADAFRGNNIGIVFQQNHFVKSLTVLENILLANQLAGKPSDTAFAMSLLKSLGIEDQAAKKTNSLSVGQQQRVGIARALVNKPTLILADEPTSALDDKNCALVVELLQKSAAEIGATLLVVTHDYRTNQYFDKQFTIQNHV